MAENAQTIKTTTARTGIRMLGHGLDWWNGAMLIALGFAALAAVSVVVTTTAVIIVQRREATAAKEEFERYKVGVAGQVADAKREGIEAGKTAGDAVLRAAELEKEAANARLETERLKAQLAWRSLPPDMAKTLSERLSEHPGKVTVQYGSNDPESQYFAIYLANIFQAANWQVAMLSVTFANVLATGLIIPNGASTDIDAMRIAFRVAGIPFSSVPVPSSAIATGNMIQGSAILFVGSKPLPKL